MKLGFCTTGNSQTTRRTTQAVCLGKLRNTIGSTTRKFKFCNKNSPNLNATFNCVFNINKPNKFNGLSMKTYHIIEYLEDNETKDKHANIDKISIPFTPTQIKTAYSISNILPANGIRKSIVTIISAYTAPNLISDVAKFGNYFGLPPCNLKVYTLSKTFSQLWATETTLDVEWTYAINPYAEIRVVLAASSSLSDIFAAIGFANNKKNFNSSADSDIISMSFGINDNGGLATLNNYFSNINTTYIASSGDNNIPTFPSSSTNVLSIGGTSLYLNSDNTRQLETVWNGSGCGYSKSFTKPSYQPVMSTNNLRITPDMSCIADTKTPCYAIINGTAASVSGTSLSAPIYAGMLSLITQNRLNNNKKPFTSVQNQTTTIQPLLYSNQTKFYDVVSSSSGSYTAQSGFDIASGLGVLNFSNMLSFLQV